MHDTRFEQDVQKKMEELTFSPPEAVWEKVDREINGEKKRRLPLFWLFFWTALLTAGAAGIYTSVSKTKTHPEASTVIAGTTKAISSAPAGSQAAVPPASAGSQTIAAPIPDASQARSIPATPVSAGSQAASTPASTGSQTAPSPLPVSPLASNAPAVSPAANPAAIVFHRGSHSSTQSPASSSFVQHTPAVSDASAGNRPMTPGANAGAEQQPADGSFANANESIDSDKSMKTSIINTAIVPTRGSINLHASALPAGKKGASLQKIQLSPKPRWEAGFTGGIGLASQNQSFLKQTTLQPGLSAAAGILEVRPVSKRLSVSMGLGLHYYSTQIKSGEKTPGNATGNAVPGSLFYSAAFISAASRYPFYAPPVDNLTVFTNRYYFLELPVSIQWRLNHSRVLPLFWEMGVSASYLVSSNALYYDTHAAAYYKDGGVANKFQLSAATALLIGLPLWGGKLQAGPQLQYGFTNLLNTQITGAQHLLSGGLKVTFIPEGKGKK